MQLPICLASLLAIVIQIINNSTLLKFIIIIIIISEALGINFVFLFMKI